MHSYPQTAISWTDRWTVVTALVGTNLLLIAAVVLLHSRALWVLAAMAFCVVAVAALRSPDLAVCGILFAIYSNLAVALTRFHQTSSAPLDTDARSALMVLVGLALVVPVFHYVWMRRQSIIIDTPFVLICLFAAAMLLSSMFSVDPALAWRKLFRFFAEGLVLYLLVINAVRGYGALRKAMWALLLAGAFMAAFSVFQEATGTLSNTYWGLAQRGGVFAIGASGETVLLRTRAAGAIGEQNRYAQILLVVLPFALYFVRHAGSRKTRMLALVCGGLLVAGVVLTFSRGASIALALLLIAMMFLRVTKVSHVAFAVLVISVFLYVREPDYLMRLASMGRIHTLFSTKRATADASAVSRVAGNRASIRVFLENPIIGVGRGVYAVHYAAEEVNRLGVRQVRNYPSHNLYLNLAAETGIVGLTLFLAILGLIVLRLRNLRLYLYANPELRDLAACFLLGLLAYLFSGLFLHLAYERYFWLQIAMCSAAIRGMSHALVVEAPIAVASQYRGRSHSLSRPADLAGDSGQAVHGF